MTRYNPNLRVNQLKVIHSGGSVFHEKFHSGLNILRGQNSSGKSTIMDFLFYGLGGDLLENQWRETAANCDSVMVEAAVNGSPLTLWRDVETASLRPMKLFFGSMEEASASVSEGWETYPFRRSSKESFSQVLFRFLGLPQVEYGESNSRLTINQVLRLIYSDQMSPVEKIFRPQRHDLAITRQAVGEMLCGAYDDAFYKAQLRKKVALEELRELSSKILFLTKTHGRDGKPLTEEWVAAEQSQLEKAIAGFESEIEKLESEVFNSDFDDRLTLNVQRTAYKRVVTLQGQISEVEESLMKENLARSDTAEYVSSLEQKLEELHQSHVVVEELGGLTFNFCPACLAPIQENEVEGACTLCKNAHDDEEAKKRVLKLINEYARQLDRAETVQKQRTGEITHLNSRLSELTELWKQATENHSVVLRNPTSEKRSLLRSLNQKAGYAYREREELARVKAVVGEIADLRNERDSLQREIEQLDNTIDAGKRAQEQRLDKARAGIEACALDFLKRDLARQSTFERANHVTFEFDADRLAVNDESYFSASSMVYLRNSFFASFLFAAANDSEFLHPRFLMMDTIEDKGLEPDRSKNFQRLLLEKSKTALSEHQIIIATSMIAEELDIPEITVGDSYTHDHRTLRLEG